MLDGVDTGFTGESVKVYVKAQAVQAYGFKSAKEAFDAGKLKDNPWASEDSGTVTSKNLN